MPVPGYRSFRIGLPGRGLRSALASHRADLVHLASPFVLGATVHAWPTVAVYQTDIPGYARVYRAGRLGEAAAWHWLRRIHNAADRTLAPSTASARGLRAHGVHRVRVWGRGVDTELFDPARRNERLRRELAPGGEVLVGYVGRLAPEKRVDLLGQVAALPGTRLVIGGAGPPSRRCAGPCRGRRSSGPGTAPTWPGFTPASTSSCTAAHARRSGRRCRRPRPAGSRSSPRRRAGRWTSSAKAPPVSSCPRERRDRWRKPCRGWCATRRCVPRWGTPRDEKVAGRTWPVLGDELIGHYAEVLDSSPRGYRGKAAR